VHGAGDRRVGVPQCPSTHSSVAIENTLIVAPGSRRTTEVVRGFARYEELVGIATCSAVTRVGGLVKRSFLSAFDAMDAILLRLVDDAFNLNPSS
jgi:hypothetical protein